MSIEAVKKVELFPMNKSSNSNTWSPEDGVSVLVFNIGAEEKYLKTDSVALNFKLTLSLKVSCIKLKLNFANLRTSVTRVQKGQPSFEYTAKFIWKCLLRRYLEFSLLTFSVSVFVYYSNMQFL